MTYIVNDSCIKCKYMDCVEVCPVDCFYEGENMLVIHPDECIDCGVCEPECPVEAIKPDTEPGLEKWLERERRIRQGLAEHHGQEGTAGRRQGIGKGCPNKFDGVLFEPTRERATEARLRFTAFLTFVKVCQPGATLGSAITL